MQIITVAVGYQRTESIGDYNNVKPSLVITADISPDDNIKAIVNSLANQCRRHVESQIDATLEDQGQAARFSNDPRFRLVHWPSMRLLALLRNAAPDPDLGNWNHYLRDFPVAMHNQRAMAIYPHADQYAKRHGLDLIDLSDSSEEHVTPRIGAWLADNGAQALLKIEDMGPYFVLPFGEYWSRHDVTLERDWRLIRIVPTLSWLDNNEYKYIDLGTWDNLRDYVAKRLDESEQPAEQAEPEKPEDDLPF